ncbi:antitrypsin-like [Nylanderia fulva]|uniref:antitrypsin-like n=1 Tax=Nylanderia fulva TaxID=613905 RepID=UPI0010FB53A8|nr:antitrypsin-like [Nylanderia fulva]
MNELRSVLGYDNKDNFDFEYYSLLYWLTNGEFVMIILLPDLEIELKDLENNFNWETLVTQVHECRFAYNFNLYLPKFKVNITRDVKDVLLKMGLNATFNDNANFTRLGRVPSATPESLFSKAIIRKLKAHQDAVMRAARAFDDNVNFTPPLAKMHLKVNSVIHKSCIEVQEHTEAKDKPGSVRELKSQQYKCYARLKSPIVNKFNDEL